MFEGLHAYLPELNPILSFANFQQSQLSDFIMNGAGSLSATLPPINSSEGPRHYLRQFGAINARGLGLASKRPEYERGNAYPGAELPQALAPAGHRRVVRLQARRRHQAQRHGRLGRPASCSPSRCSTVASSRCCARAARRCGSPPPDNLGSAPASP